MRSPTPPPSRGAVPSHRLGKLLAVAALIASWCTPAAPATTPPKFPPVHFPSLDGTGQHIQRTMRLLATSTPEQPNTVRVLFYGQSITEQGWWRLVEADLRRRFPHAHLVVENRALGGFAAQLLVKTAETDLYPFNPDLVIFHVYGSHERYEDIIRRIRERTTAEILMQTDHVTSPDDLVEETDPAKLRPEREQWNAFMNQRWLPEIAARYGAELCDQRSLWKGYLRQHNLEPSALLSDAVHLNAHGEWLMAQCVIAWLRRDPALAASPAEDWITTLAVEEDLAWKDGHLRVEFEGNGIEVALSDTPGASAEVWIDGRRPSEFPELYGPTRAVLVRENAPPVKWPLIAPIARARPAVIEDWVLTARARNMPAGTFSFTIRGSVTGPDGEGSSDAAFLSTSGRVAIAPEAWNVPYAMRLARIDPIPETFTVQWSVVPRFVDEVRSVPSAPSGAESRQVVAHGLPNTRHVLELRGTSASPIRAIRIHRPPLASTSP